jgi:two-component system sensor histidine kinase KdpD
VNIAADLPLVPLDGVLFDQVVRNLVENADRYSPKAQPIEISARIEDRQLRFSVADRGPGLRPGEELRAFEKFYRGPDSTDGHGVGLGLAICKGIVDAHGGWIEGKNRVGGGAEFTVWLPLEGDPPTVESEPAENRSQQTS